MRKSPIILVGRRTSRHDDNDSKDDDNDRFDDERDRRDTFRLLVSQAEDQDETRQGKEEGHQKADPTAEEGFVRIIGADLR